MINIIIYALIGITALYSFINYIIICITLKKGNNILKGNLLSGCEVASKLLEQEQLNNIYIIETKNPLEERYDPNRNVIRLSNKVFNGTNATDICIASFESMYAIEDNNGNKYIKLRNILLPVISILIYIIFVGIIVSLILNDFKFFNIFIGMFFIINLIDIILLNKDKELITKLFGKLKLLNIDEIEKILEIIDCLSYYYVAYPFILINKMIKLIKNKISS